MGLDKASSKSGGFFHLFDWNKKSRKKLFASGTVSPVESKQKTHVNIYGQTIRAPNFIEEDNSGVVSCIKGSDYRCASSVTDEEGLGIRAPGVVARLMGLDALPGTSVPENYSTPFIDPRSIQDKSYQKRSFNGRDGELGRADCYYRKPIELRSQKTPSSPIERFQTEVLPPRTARSFSMNQYKLLSPIKNPRFFSGKDAAHIMEAAAKILESAPNVNATKFTVSSLSRRIQDTKDNIALCQRASKLSEFSRRSSEPNSLGHSQESKCGSRTVSLAVQAKVNVKKREGSSSPSCSTSSVPREAESSSRSQPFKSQRSYKNKPPRKASPAPPGVLRQNNQKQNGPQAKDRITAAKTSVRKTATSGDSSTGRDRNLAKNKAIVKEDPEQEKLTSRIRKKRSIDWKNSSSESTFVGRREKRIQPSIAIDEHKKWDEGIKGSDTDVVSFTFTSPMSKPAAEKSEVSIFPLNLHGERDNPISGDPLSILLEKKLRELASGFDSSSRLGEVGSLSSPSYLFTGPASSSDKTKSTGEFGEPTKPMHGSRKTRFGDPVNRNPTTQEDEEPITDKESERRSPISTLEATFSAESFASCDVSDSRNGCKVASSSREEEEHDVSDSASSSFNVAVKEPSAAPPPSFGGSPTTLRREAEYVRAVLLKADVDSPSPLNPLLYDQLEKEEQKEKLNKVGTLRRKALFDCVGEFLDSRRRRHLSAGYRAWAKGATAVAGGVDRLAEAAHREILRWEGMVDFMVEDLVEKDMAPWVDFEAEYFENGVDVEEQILSSIVDDVLDDVLAVYHRQLHCG